MIERFPATITGSDDFAGYEAERANAYENASLSHATLRAYPGHFKKRKISYAKPIPALES